LEKRLLEGRWDIGLGSERFRQETYIEEDYSLLTYFIFGDGKTNPETEKELEEKGLRMKSYENFLESDENEIASDLQSQLNKALAYLAERNTDTQL
jgi:hypothetical protein